MTVGFDAVLADVYWIRAVQYYGDTKLSTSEKKEYGLLYPLLDITTTLDPRFNIAYRFGAILLSEGYPNGPGNPDEAIALLQKGIREMPDRWQYYHDAGFVEYRWRQDYKAASEWLLKAAKLPNAPRWLEPTAASMLARGGDRNSARALWSELAATSGQDWIRSSAKKALLQLDAETVIEQLEFLTQRFFDARGRFPASWNRTRHRRVVEGNPARPVWYALRDRLGVRHRRRRTRFTTVPAAAGGSSGGTRPVIPEWLARLVRGACLAHALAAFSTSASIDCLVANRSYGPVHDARRAAARSPGMRMFPSWAGWRWGAAVVPVARRSHGCIPQSRSSLR